MKIKKQILLIIVTGIMCLFVKTKNVEAVLQANGNSETLTADVSNWIVNIRKMESTGGTLGLNEDNISDNLSSTEESNNLDIHMEKNTEYGAMAILSASAYGNQKKIENGETTTGNKSGIYIFLNREWVAAGELYNFLEFKRANSKYKNEYTNVYAKKVGDAIEETYRWHNSNGNIWISNGDCGLYRANSYSIFDYVGGSGNHYAEAGYKNRSRAVVVVGKGF